MTATLAARCEGSPYNAGIGVRVESIEPERVRVRIPYADENSNPGRALHGGVVASIINIAGALVAVTTSQPNDHSELGTLDLSVNYLAAAIGEDIVAEADVLRRGKEIVYSDVGVRNDAGKWIAKGLVTFRALAAAPRHTDRQLHTSADVGMSAREVPQMVRMLEATPFMARLGMSIVHMHGGHARVEMPFKPANADDGEAVHEGALAALIDTTGAMAAWSIVGLDFRYKASTVGIHVNYHAPAIKEDVVAQARTLRRNNEIFLNQVTVSGCQSGRLVAAGSVTYRIVVPAG